MPSADTNILEFTQYQGSEKTPFNIYTDLESLIEKIDRSKSNPSITKLSEHIASGFSMSTYLHLKTYKIRMMYEDCMKKFCESLRKYRKNEVLANKQQESY